MTESIIHVLATVYPILPLPMFITNLKTFGLAVRPALFNFVQKVKCFFFANEGKFDEILTAGKFSEANCCVCTEQS